MVRERQQTTHAQRTARCDAVVLFRTRLFSRSPAPPLHPPTHKQQLHRRRTPAGSLGWPQPVTVIELRSHQHQRHGEAAGERAGNYLPANSPSCWGGRSRCRWRFVCREDSQACFSLSTKRSFDMLPPPHHEQHCRLTLSFHDASPGAIT